MSPSTASRRRLIRKLLGEGTIASQGQLVDLLEAEGLPVTQATVSRDLDALGATKVRSAEGAVHYTIAGEPAALTEAESWLRRSINEFVEEIAVSDNVVVLHTPPGAAHLVAGAIDGANLDGVLGTVAGDDTLMVVAAPQRGGAAVAAKIEQIGAR
ncbi:MAG: arginine repressor [Acidimicrobiia bacterium]|nr:arginine repressor [Acidimicrobiia bacterium]